MAATRKAVSYYRELVGSNSWYFLSFLTRSLSNLSEQIHKSGRLGEFLDAIQESVEIYRELAQDYPNNFLPLLAVSLRSLGDHLAALGKREQAQRALEESVRHFEELVKTDPSFRSELAASLNSLGREFFSLNLFREARRAVKRAVDIWSELAASNPQDYCESLAAGYCNLSAVYDSLGHSRAALRAMKKSVGYYQELVKTRPEFRLHLALSFNYLGDRLNAVGKTREALKAYEQAARELVSLALSSPDVCASHASYMARDYARAFWCLGQEPDTKLMETLWSIASRDQGASNSCQFSASI